MNPCSLLVTARIFFKIPFCFDQLASGADAARHSISHTGFSLSSEYVTISILNISLPRDQLAYIIPYISSFVLTFLA
jgi:hypothetical protein